MRYEVILAGSDGLVHAGVHSVIADSARAAAEGAVGGLLEKWAVSDGEWPDYFLAAVILRSESVIRVYTVESVREVRSEAVEWQPGWKDNDSVSALVARAGAQMASREEL